MYYRIGSKAQRPRSIERMVKFSRGRNKRDVSPPRPYSRLKQGEIHLGGGEDWRERERGKESKEIEIPVPHEYLGPPCSCNGVFIRGCRFYITQPGRSFAIRPPALPASQRGFPDRGIRVPDPQRSSFTRPMVLITLKYRPTRRSTIRNQSTRC